MIEIYLLIQLENIQCRFFNANIAFISILLSRILNLAAVPHQRHCLNTASRKFLICTNKYVEHKNPSI